MHIIAHTYTDAYMHILYISRVCNMSRLVNYQPEKRPIYVGFAFGGRASFCRVLVTFCGSTLRFERKMKGKLWKMKQMLEN